MDKSAVCRVAADVENLSEIRRFIVQAALAAGVEPGLAAKVQLAVDEAATNIIVHGYHGRAGFVEIRVQRAQDALIICLRDQADPFDPSSVPPPNLSLPLEQRRLGGLGVYLIRQVMDEIIHHDLPEGGNELILVKKLGKPSTDE